MLAKSWDQDLLAGGESSGRRIQLFISPSLHASSTHRSQRLHVKYKPRVAISFTHTVIRLVSEDMTTNHRNSSDANPSQIAMRTKPPPSFGSQAYWDDRFASNTDPFEWLEAPNAIDPYIVDALNAIHADKPEFLHIGCGTSLLSFHLRSHVHRPGQIHNLDYSDVAIQIGKAREEEIYQYESQRGGNLRGVDMPCMRWDTVDLLDYASVLGVCRRACYSVIVDKSTSDSISCSDDVRVPIPYPAAIRSYGPVDLDPTKTSELVHPLVVMAVNLALVTKPGARWITLSYSKERFFFLDDPSDAVPQGMAFPHPADLWRLIERREVEDVDWQVRNERRDDAVTHRPKVCNSVYILERTEVPLFVRGEHI